MMKFFDIYRSELDKGAIDQMKIYNMDEIGITTVHMPGRVLAAKGQKQVGKITSGEHGETLTVICAMSASGYYVPLMFIFK
jgi:hypothetical protein